MGEPLTFKNLADTCRSLGYALRYSYGIYHVVNRMRSEILYSNRSLQKIDEWLQAHISELNN